MRQRLRRAAIGECFYRVRRVHVLVAHEPARLIGADRQYREPQWTVGLGDTPKMLALPIAGLADDVDLACGRLQHKACPQRLVAVEQSARRPLPGRHQRYRESASKIDAITPGERLPADRTRGAAPPQVVPDRRD